jgi:hypothetical protein
MGSGLGKNTVWRGDVDIQLFDEGIRHHFRLGSLRFGDLVAIVQGDTRFGPALRQGRTTIGVVVHSDSTVSGHGPGVTPLLTGSAARLQPIYNPQANLAVLFDLRMLPPAKSYRPITGSRRNWGKRLTATTVPQRRSSEAHRQAQKTQDTFNINSF